jgi:uncharacterized RDD family membrane protein YckC
MTTRFDEIELEPVPLIEEQRTDPIPAAHSHGAPLHKRAAILLIDLSLFAALFVALLPLLSSTVAWWVVASLAGFVVIVSFYYFAGAWLIWGRTIGGAIFDVKVVPASGSAMTLRAASLRWLGLFVSLLTAGLGFLIGLCDRISGTRSVSA